MRATEPIATIITRRVRPGSERAYEDWLYGVSLACGTFSGYQGTTILRPAAGDHQYVAVLQFDASQNLNRWLASTERAHWLKKLEAIDVQLHEVASLAGMERWFTLPEYGANHPPPRYKTATMILIGLYPTVLLLNLTLRDVLADVAPPLKTLVSLLISVPLMVWAIVPLLNRLFSWWLHPGGHHQSSTAVPAPVRCEPIQRETTR